MPRYKLTVEYDGTGLVGWQRQDNGPSVQAALEDACAILAGGPVAVQGAGRTDAGVHALGQVAHVDLDRDMAPGQLALALNFHLRPAAVAVLAAEPVAAGFHARFGAIRRSYLYRIVNRRAPLTLDEGRAWRVGRPLDVHSMEAAAALLVGRHDFSSFRAAACQADSALRTLDRLDVAAVDGEVRIVAEARSFLHSQVRFMVGTLVAIGGGRWPAAEAGRILAARDRRRAGPVAPPHGLYLARVDYPEPPGPESSSAMPSATPSSTAFQTTSSTTSASACTGAQPSPARTTR